MLAPTGSERDQQTLATRRKSYFSFQIISFTLYSDAASGWTEANKPGCHG